MRINLTQRRRTEQGSIVAYFICLLILVSAIASVCAFVTQSLNVTHRHNEMVEAHALAEGGATLAAAELESAMTNQSAGFLVNLANNPAGAYSKNAALSSSQSNVYQRVITSPFSSGSVTVQIWTTNVTAPPSARIVGTATVGKVTQSTSLQLQMSFGYGAALISDSDGTTSTSISKSVAQQGNVVLDGSDHGPLVVDAGTGYAVLANGRVNYNNWVTVPPGSISMTNASTANAVPDYTAEGAANQLFDFNRFIAVADLTPGGAAPNGNNHFTNLISFLTTAMLSTPASPLEGVIVVNIKKSDLSNIEPKDVPNGINVRGTLIFNFAPDVDPNDKIVNTATMNINAADLSGLNPADRSTFTTGYPPVYSNPAKNPVNIDISSKGFKSFAEGDDLPALMYSIGILDIHGNANICGVIYTPSFMEIENKQDDQTQYFKGSLIGGGGIYLENDKKANTIVSYDPNALDVLATSGTKGKVMKALYWQ